jgi:glycolate oxidase
MDSITQKNLESELLKFLPRTSVIVDIETKRPFECDGLTALREVPMLVALPHTVDQVKKIMALCHRHSVPVVARGAGTGLSAGALPNAHGVLLSLTKFNQIIEVDPLARTARVQPGVTNLGISEAVADLGLYYAPDPSSQIACTIGGNVAENSGGVHCLKYGLTVHNVLSVELITVEGEQITLGSEALDGPGLDMMALICGSEGLLGVLIEVTVRLLPSPPAARVVMAGFDSVIKAGDAVAEIIGRGIIPAGLEMMDSLAIQAAENFAGAGYPIDAEALLLCEIDGSEQDVEENIAQVVELFRNLGAGIVKVSATEQERELLWKGRKSAFPAMGQISADYYCMDGTIPRKHLSYVLIEMKRMSAHYGLRVANVFHAGDGNLHPLILYDANVPGELDRAEQFGGKILELCVAVGGCITGEHGVGVEKLRQMPRQFNDAEISQFHAVKSAFDPQLTLNPGKGIPTLRQCQEYRALDSQSVSSFDLSHA